jgi:hypothetical protein
LTTYDLLTGCRLSKQTDNSNIELKVAVRNLVYEKIDEPVVLDLYCGSGIMYKEVWHKANSYLGVDKYSPHKLDRTIKLSAEMAVANLDLSLFNIFDVDCYDSPWIVARRILHKLDAGRHGLVLTSGEWRSLCSTANEIVRATLGLSGFSDLRLLIRYQKLINLLMIKSLTEIKGVVPHYGAIAYTNRNIAYIGLVVDKTIQ